MSSFLFFQILLATLISRAVPISIAFWVIFKQLRAFMDPLLGVASGLMLSIAFLHLLPEAFEHAKGDHVSIYLSIGVCLIVFWGIEHLFSHHHHHQSTPQIGLSSLFSGAALHNLLDGLLIASAFFIQAQLGWIAALSVIAHEIPQQMSYLIVLEKAGKSKNQSLVTIIVLSSFSLLGATLGFFFVSQTNTWLAYLLAVSGTSFCFIVFHSLIPLWKNSQSGFWKQLIASVIGILLATLVLHPH